MSHRKSERKPELGPDSGVVFRRSPDSLVKPLRESELEDADKVLKRAEKVKTKVAKATRRVVLIRHGQYNEGNLL